MSLQPKFHCEVSYMYMLRRLRVQFSVHVTSKAYFWLIIKLIDLCITGQSIARVKNYMCLCNTTHRCIYVSTYIAFLRVVMLNFLRGRSMYFDKLITHNLFTLCSIVFDSVLNRILFSFLVCLAI